MTDWTADNLREFIETNLLDGRRVENDEDLLLSGAIDSLGVMSLVAQVERLRGARIPPEDVTLENFTSINAMLGYLNGHLPAFPPSHTRVAARRTGPSSRTT